MTHQWQLENKEKQREYQKLSRIKHRDANRQRDRERYAANKERWKQYYLDNREVRLQASKEYKKSDKYREYARKYMAKRLKENVNVLLASRMRHRIHRALKNNFKASSMKEFIGCSMDELRLHLESRFNKDMTWDNYGEWHIDHVIPISSFDLSDPEQQRKCFHYSNLQPLWAMDNFVKSDKIKSASGA